MLALDMSLVSIGDALMYNDPVENPDILEQIREHAPRESVGIWSHFWIGKADDASRTTWMSPSTSSSRLGTWKIYCKYRWSDENNSLKTGMTLSSENGPIGSPKQKPDVVIQTQKNLVKSRVRLTKRLQILWVSKRHQNRFRTPMVEAFSWQRCYRNWRWGHHLSPTSLLKS